MSSPKLSSFKEVVEFVINTFISPFTTILIILSVLYFLYGLSKYIRTDLGDSDKEEAKQVMFWGIIGLFAIVAMWGLVTIIQKTFNLDTSTINLPSDAKPLP